jgi:threonine synthase
MFHSTNHKSPEVNFNEAILQGQASDNGLFMLNNIPQINKELLTSFKEYSFREIAFEVLNHIINGYIPDNILKDIVYHALNFEIPIKEFGSKNYICFLDRGPTCSFKDVGARILARILEYILKIEEKDIIILTATSGDTGGAVAQAFYKKKRIQVIVLFPENEITNLQRKQMTTLGENITAIGINGKFDDCQYIVKKAFADKTLKGLNLTSANSINFGRLLPQSIYYFWSHSQVTESTNESILYSVPSGNFGNLTGGLIANRMGLNIKKFIAAVNENDEFPRFLKTGNYTKVEPSKECISNAMNVGHPSNLARIFDLYGGQIDENGMIVKNPDLNAIRNDIVSFSISDYRTKQTIINFYEQYNSILDPHGAVGWTALQKYRKYYPEYNSIKAICFETADPAKFPEEISPILQIKLKIPLSLKKIQTKKEIRLSIEINDYHDFKAFLQKKYIE